MFQSECFKICHTFGIRQSTYFILFVFNFSWNETKRGSYRIPIIQSTFWIHFTGSISSSRKSFISEEYLFSVTYMWRRERKERHIATPTFRRFYYWSTSSHTQPSFPASFQIQVLSIDSSSIYLPIHLWKWFLLW